MISLSSLNPYALYIKIVAVALVVALLVGMGVWIRGVFSERAALRVSVAAATEKQKLAESQTAMYVKQWNDNAVLQREVADAIKKIKVQSNNYISTVEVSGPVGTDGESVVLMRPDQAINLPTGFGDNSAGRVGTDAAGTDGNETR